MTPADRSKLLLAASIIAIAFGLLTIASGGTVLFGGEEAKAAVGNAVPFVLWFNFAAGFAYIAAGAGLFFHQRWAVGLSAAIALATLLVFAAFGFHVMQGGAFEMRTVGAMILRSAVWIAIAIVGYRKICRK